MANSKAAGRISAPVKNIISGRNGATQPAKGNPSRGKESPVTFRKRG